MRQCKMIKKKKKKNPSQVVKTLKGGKPHGEGEREQEALSYWMRVGKTYLGCTSFSPAT